MTNSTPSELNRLLRDFDGQSPNVGARLTHVAAHMPDGIAVDPKEPLTGARP